MKRIKLLAMLLSLALLCCACSAAAIREPEQEAGNFLRRAVFP